MRKGVESETGNFSKNSRVRNWSRIFLRSPHRPWRKLNLLILQKGRNIRS